MTKILIVEDEPDMVLGLKDNFEFEGYEVLTAADGAAGLERARQHKPVRWFRGPYYHSPRLVVACANSLASRRRTRNNPVTLRSRRDGAPD